MANIFSSKPATSVQVGPKQTEMNKYNGSRGNLLLVVIATAINVLLLITGSGTYFLFSASVPYVITDLGMYLCGMYPKDAYAGDEVFLSKGVLAVFVIIAALIVGLYLLCYFLSKKRVGWLIASLVLFCFDTVFMVWNYGINQSFILDYIFHAWVIVSLILGVRAYFKAKKLPEDHVLTVSIDPVCPEAPDSTPLRAVDPSDKARILCSAELLGRKVEYRRVKKTNELVINGYVYDEYTATLEMPHTLTAYLDGHIITASYENSSSVIALDGVCVKRNVRWY